MSAKLHHQLHGYRSGHQLLQSTARMQRKDQDLIDQLSDMAGPLRPGEKFDPYISTYPLPSLEYYVFARTEQDFDAPRSGCVKTRSLLVPQRYWESEASPSALARLLERPVGDVPIPAPEKDRDSALAPVSSPMLAELIEALFLRDRRAIVVFDAPMPSTIALRLLIAFWPVMRGSFSLCTSALSPRTLAGKSFDLVFAPETARSRFSDWDGRRIGPLNKNIGERYRWADQIQQSVFQSDNPTLLNAKYVRALGGGETRVDATFLRLLMLWGDLQERAARSPTAVLGLIDIASSRGALGVTKGLLEPEITNAMNVASGEMDPDEAWKFLGTLMEKLSGMELPQGVYGDLRSTVARLVQRDWESALRFLVEHVSFRRAVETRLSKEIAAELATLDVVGLRTSLNLVAADCLIQILLLDDNLLALALADKLGRDTTSLLDGVIEGWRHLGRSERATEEMRLLSHIRGEQHSALAAEIVKEIKAERLTEAVKLVWGQMALRGEELGKVFCDAAVKKDVKEDVRSVFAGVDSDEATNRCILRLLSPISADMKWVLESPELVDRRTWLLSMFVGETSQNDLAVAFNSPDAAGGALDLFMRDIDEFNAVAARIVALPAVSRRDQVEQGLKLYPYLDPPRRVMVGQCIASGVLAESQRRNNEEIEHALDLVLPDIDMSVVIDDVFGIDSDGETVSGSLTRIEELAGGFLSSVEQNVGRIAELIASRAEFDLTADGTRSLANLIEEAKSCGTETHIQMCCRILPFAMAAGDKPASPIIIAAFPTVHNRLERERELFGFMHLFMLGGWDRARTARKDLVRAFMKAEWPPVDMAVAGVHANALHRILKRVVKEPRGRHFLGKIEQGARGLKKNVHSTILREIKEVRKTRAFVLESET